MSYGTSKRRLDRGLWWGGSALAAAVLARWQLARWFTPHPEYELEEQLGELEIRRYPPQCVAETRISAATWEVALRRGFERLARYVFGNNQRTLPPAAVAQEPRLARGARARAERLRMTTPVRMRLERPENLARTYTVSFGMPLGRSAESLPVPRDARILVTSKPPRRVAVLRYRGQHDQRTVSEKFSELLVQVGRAGLCRRGEPEFAGYDPPSTLPVLRRNEVWVELAG
jgi:hypothetical protein